MLRPTPSSPPAPSCGSAALPCTTTRESTPPTGSASDSPRGTRWDLGLLEIFFWLALSFVVPRAQQKAPARRILPALYLFAYAAFRLAIDPLRTDRVYYAGISVDTYVCAAGVLLGLVFAWKARALPDAYSEPGLARCIADPHRDRNVSGRGVLRNLHGDAATPIVVRPAEIRRIHQRGAGPFELRKKRVTRRKAPNRLALACCPQRLWLRRAIRLDRVDFSVRSDLHIAVPGSDIDLRTYCAIYVRRLLPW